MKRSIKLFGLLALGAAVAACDVTPEEENEEELITTLRITFTETGTSNTVSAVFQDLDGDGGDAATLTNPTFAANTTYSATIEVLNESETPAEDITAEVEEEGAEHQFFFELSSGTGITTEYTDDDGSGNPVGLSFNLTTTDAGTGTMIVTLRHEPNKSASGVSGGDITNAGGETDIEVTFDVTVQ
ncbi:MAG TPA: type 1 periplasmic binding fold superfamily protein [Cytophagales bacterium]|nr:type 1 periplasmic binding fold superfamily protein [Cytophagales bacterium]HAA20168.1 type 1 periplasmic binding fold superfamily protein [Cytophagales bacterium]HAP64157.1 type 1 periplasmic binding fold superfamily protein [Cytophagales bacterium]